MNWGLFVLICLGIFNSTWAMSKHGEQRSPYNGLISFIGAILDILLGFWIAGWKL